jgi:DHA2 family multidrug resistance protein-like MFS transporter
MKGHMMQNSQEDGSGLPEPRRLFAIAALLTSMVLVVLDGVITNVALPTITQSLHITPAMSVWVVTAYQLGLVSALLPCAALGESFGYRGVFSGGVLLFTVASGFCALSPSLPWLAAARFVQGLGGAAVMALCVALLRFTVAQRQLGAAIGWNALTIALASAAGPAIGAVILSNASWPWLFAVNIPIGLLTLSATRALPLVAGTRRRLDVVSVVLNAGAFAALVIGVDLLPGSPPLGIALLAAAAAGAIALVRREMPREAPLIPLDLLRNASFGLSVIASVCCFAGQTAGVVMLPFYLQHSLGQSTFMTGLYMTPWPLTVAVAAPLAGRLANRVSTGSLCAAGGACLAVGLTAAALWPLRSGLLPLVPITMLCGAGFGFFQVPNNRNMFLSAPKQRSGAAGGMQGTARLVGQTAGAVGVTLLFTLTSADIAPRIGLAIGGALTLAGGLVSLLRAR